MRVPAALIEIVMLHEHRRGQNEIGHGGRFGHELLVDDREEILAGKTLLHLLLLRRDGDRIGVLDEQRRHRPLVAQGVGFTEQNVADPRLIELADRAVDHIEALDHRFPQAEGAGIRVESAAAPVLPRAKHGGDAQGRMHVHRAVALAGEAIAQPEEGAALLAQKACDSLDLRGRHPADRLRPFRRPEREMRLEFGREIREPRHVIAIREVLAQQHMENAGRQRAIRAGSHEKRVIGLPHRLVPVDIHRDDGRAPGFAGLDRVVHHVHLGVHGIRAPDHDDLAFGHLARIDARQASRAGDEAGPGHVGADRVVETGIFLRVSQAIDAVAHHEAHRSGVVIGPDGLASLLPLGGEEGLRRAIQGLIPADGPELARTLGAGAQQRFGQPIRVVDALGIARDLRADHAVGVALALEPAHAPDARIGQNLDLERAGARAIMRAHGRTKGRLRGKRSIHRARILTD